MSLANRVLKAVEMTFTALILLVLRHTKAC